jgi:hypothetical protein
MCAAEVYLESRERKQNERDVQLLNVIRRQRQVEHFANTMTYFEA